MKLNTKLVALAVTTAYLASIQNKARRSLYRNEQLKDNELVHKWIQWAHDHDPTKKKYNIKPGEAEFYVKEWQ